MQTVQRIKCSWYNTSTCSSNLWTYHCHKRLSSCTKQTWGIVVHELFPWWLDQCFSNHWKACAVV